MRRIQILFCVCMGLVAGIVLAQSEADYAGWMKQIAATNKQLKGNIAAKDMKAAKANAKILEDNFKEVEMFWSKRGNAADAVNLAKQANMAASNVMSAVGSGDWDKAGTEAGAIGGTCGQCHMAHRGKGSDGKPMIK